MELTHLASRGSRIHVFEISLVHEDPKEVFALINLDHSTIQFSLLADQFYKFGYFEEPLNILEGDLERIKSLIESNFTSNLKMLLSGDH